MKYVAQRQEAGDGSLWEVVGPPDFEPLPNLSEAESNIIAFALNAVAEGHGLIKGSVGGPGWVYEGPTEGIAP
jgi:hypothetical protein